MNEAYCVKCGFIGTKYDMNHRCFCGEIVWFEKAQHERSVKTETGGTTTKQPLPEILAKLKKGE